MSETVSKSSCKSKDMCYSATTSKSMLLKKKAKQQQWAMTVVWQTSHHPYTQAYTSTLYVKMTLLLRMDKKWQKHTEMIRNSQLILIWRLLPQFSAKMLDSRSNNKVRHGFSKNRPKFTLVRSGTDQISSTLSNIALHSSQKHFLKMIRHHWSQCMSFNSYHNLHRLIFNTLVLGNSPKESVEQKRPWSQIANNSKRSTNLTCWQTHNNSTV